MTMKLLTIMTLLLSLWAPITHADATTGTQKPVATILIPFTILDSGPQSGIHPETQSLTMIQDEATWQSFWTQHVTITPRAPAPNVDFSKNMVITVIDTDQPNSGYSLHLDKVEQHGEELLVYVTREQPAPACMNLGMVAQPYVLAIIPKSPLPVKLVFLTHTYEC